MKKVGLVKGGGGEKQVFQPILLNTGKLFSYFSTKIYVVGTQKNRLNEKVLLSTQNTCLNWWVKQ